MVRTRFAPSPTGPLHLGHAYSALLNFDAARRYSGEFLLRLEDIDQSRARPEWERLIHDDLRWLGLEWPEPVMVQSQRLPVYRAALSRLWDTGLLYICTCKRRDIEAALSAPQEGAPLHGPDGLIYPGTCRHRMDTPRPPAPMPEEAVLRLDMAKALDRIPAKRLIFDETGAPHAGDAELDRDTLIKRVGDFILARAGMGTSYHLSVVIDDAEQQITDVIRGEDLFDATAIHVVLQALLDLPTPRYHHHHLIRDETGKRLAKRDDARAIRLYRQDGATPKQIRQMVGLSTPSAS
ncbi:tRNA glutamyl-Q(34) synthetase GluQRS [Qingshengfaniella alkalisoli]|uniref:tRNA glutamyl-Q(34) synthetase GluQRS n=1 Tax=Qingshengfaniella alkalisoli TaxID=2599296 RepID=A0A5B8IU60_9RHOB|nr:tRNA glutamyl-Q(34) synthetase GluQRS [Qingshengfaniella alkalisoli]QDY69164.1 tRNA glutamyl-Q(34) synthetase GluQRS [Qingshengfaniella alkalisoli]